MTAAHIGCWPWLVNKLEHHAAQMQTPSNFGKPAMVSLVMYMAQRHLLLGYVHVCVSADPALNAQGAPGGKATEAVVSICRATVVSAKDKAQRMKHQPQPRQHHNQACLSCGPLLALACNMGTCAFSRWTLMVACIVTQSCTPHVAEQTNPGISLQVKAFTAHAGPFELRLPKS